MVVPVSQLVLPVGVTGLTVNGKTPTPEPGSIVVGPGHPVQRTSWRHTKLCLFHKTQFSDTHIRTKKSVQLACTWISLVFLGHSRQPAKKLSHVIYYKSPAQPANSNTQKHLASLVDCSPWNTLNGQADKQARLQCKIPREIKHHHCMFIKGSTHTNMRFSYVIR